MNGFLIPANAKRGTLIFNIFRPVDLIIFGIGIALSVVLLLILNTSSMILAVIAVLPVCFTGLLVFPIPNYQNVLCVLINIYNFYTERRRYTWKGWCMYEQFREYEEAAKAASSKK
ncbi:MAG: hypothetical protein IKF19_04470 [Bacilli bacterium]|nr:hypothetical protein [Bacilli bacterium]